MDRKQRELILNSPVDVFPRIPGKPYGPRPHQKPVLINRYSLEKRLERSKLPVTDMRRLHTHGLDVLLSIGGARSGKTLSSVACGADLLLTYAGCQGIVGAMTYQDLQDTVMEEYRKIFTIDKPWDSPWVEQKPTEHKKILRLINGSFVRFINFEDWERLRGREASFIHFDEASQIETSSTYYELLRRLSGSHVPTRQLMLTTNPPESSNWLHDIFRLEQFKPGYDGPELPIGRPCRCQFCEQCLLLGREFNWVEGKCPECGNHKTTTCEGDQYFIRVIQSNLSMNDTLPASQMEDLKATTDARTFQLYGLGELIELREGKAFKPWSNANVLQFDKPVDLDKPINWSLDWNVSYECSVIVQTTNTVQGIMAEVVDEIVLPESGPEAVAKVFVNKFPQFSKLNNPNAQPILLYGDPTGLDKDSDRNERSKFQIVYDVLDQAGFDVHLMVKKVKGSTLIPVLHRIDATNTMIENANGLRRLFVNPKCAYLRKSLEGTKWLEQSKSPTIDKKCDENAAKNPDKFAVHLLTHPGEALGYWIAKVSPVVVNPKSLERPHFTIPGDATIIATEKGIIEKVFVEAEPDRPKSLMEDLNEMNGLQSLFWGWNV